MNRTIAASFVASLAACVAGASDFATEMLEATFKFFDPTATGTCFFVRREAPDDALYLVTAAHVFERTKAETAIVVLRERQGDGSFKRRDHTVAIRREGKPLWVRHAKEDTAVLRLSKAPPVPVGALPVGALADEARLGDAGLHICSSLFVLTYPKSFEGNAAGFAVARQGIIASHPFEPIGKHHTFLADFTTFAGDSGGPVFVPGKEGHPLVVGIVIAQFRHDERVKTEYEERNIHYPLGLGTVLHAQFVRETIEEAARKDAANAK